MDYKKVGKYYLGLVVFILLFAACTTQRKKTSVEKRIKKQERLKKRKNCDCTAA